MLSVEPDKLQYQEFENPADRTAHLGFSVMLSDSVPLIIRLISVRSEVQFLPGPSQRILRNIWTTNRWLPPVIMGGISNEGVDSTYPSPAPSGLLRACAARVVVSSGRR